MYNVKKLFKTVSTEGISGIPSRVNQRLGIWHPKGVPSGHICLKPYYYISIEANGYVYCCCQGWGKFSLGKLSSRASFDKLWNGRIAQLYREAMLTTDLNRVCNVNICPYILDQRLPRFKSKNVLFNKGTRGIWPCEMENDQDVINAIRRGDTRLNYLPKHLEISADERCNIYCKSCRHRPTTELTKRQQLILHQCMEVFEAIGPGLKRLSMLGSGEVFFSQFSLNLLKNLNASKYPNLHIDIVTNGQLLNQNTWNKLGEGTEFIKSITISIDSVKKETYERIRRGAQWEKVMESMAFVQSLRTHEGINSFSINFTASAENFREMADFVTLGRKFSVDKIVFTALQPWNYMEYEYKKSAVHLESHPWHEEFLQVIGNPLFHSEDVILGLRPIQSRSI